MPSYGSGTDPNADVTQLLVAYTGGDGEALEKLLPLVYSNLKRMAHVRLRNERPDHTLNTTGLVHEAYLKLIDIQQVRYQSRGHFFAMASKLMRRILVDYAVARRAQKRGGGAQRESLDEERLIPDEYTDTLLDLHDALTKLEAEHPRPAEAVQHRYFGGLTSEEAAEAMGVSLRTVERDLRFARAWLSKEWGGSGIL
ncbi:MAG: sigma-70 family RNA polymerase sigma factor [Rhodothermia bacterium]|nr:sigma-70 family RNA polymerase sigma factor [Rhodothermia bacterium]